MIRLEERRLRGLKVLQHVERFLMPLLQAARRQPAGRTSKIATVPVTEFVKKTHIAKCSTLRIAARIPSEVEEPES